ncbi:MAG: DUF4340 domain-containing protein [Deltaproteobacteria bacterium]|nr:DUF4340 domain-containing protein [Deltaproteobacteria bacterium]
MKRYKENIILIALIIVLSLYVFMHKKDQTNYKLPEIPDIAKTEITKLEIAAINSDIILKKKSGNWYIDPEGYPADKDKVNKMLDSLKDIKVTALVSQLKNYNLYDLNAEKKITIKAWNKDKLKRLFEIGKIASSYRHTFIKLEKDGLVYHAEGDFRSSFDLTKDKLRDKLVLSFEKNEISTINIHKGSTNISLAFKEVEAGLKPGRNEEPKKEIEHKSTDRVWQTTDGKICIKSKIDELFGKLSGLKCKQYINNKNKDDLKDPIFTIILKGTKESKLSIFPMQGEDAIEYPCISSATEDPFFLTKHQAENVMMDPEEIIKKEVEE